MPDLIYISFIAVLVVLSVALVALEMRRREGLRQHLEQVELRQELGEATAAADSAQSDLEKLQGETAPVLDALEIVKRQRDGLRGIIEEVQQERDVWRRMYFSQGTGHDNAQRWMMREIESLAQQVVDLGGKAKVSPTLTTVRAEFEHENKQPLEDYRSGRADQVHAETTKQETKRVEQLDALDKPPQ